MQTTTTSRTLQIANIAAFIAVLVVNTLASTVGLNGSQTGALSDAIPNLFVPSGLTFSVWGVIYVFLLLFAIQQSRGLFSPQRQPPGFLSRVGWLFVLSSAANVAWLLLWHWREVGWSLAVMAALLGALVAIYLRLGTGRTPASPAERWFARVPFSIYLGWITVATIANATAALVVSGWDGFGIAPQIWTIAVIIAAVLIALTVLATRRDAAYALVVAWALAGIAVKRSADASPASHEIYVASVAAAAAVAAGIVVTALLSILRPRPASA